jgi:hypothetical protein
MSRYYTARVGLRLSRPLASRLEGAGATISAVARACILLGLAAAGDDLSPYADEIPLLLIHVSDPAIRAAINSVFNTGSTQVQHRFNTAGQRDDWRPAGRRRH